MLVGDALGIADRLARMDLSELYKDEKKLFMTSVPCKPSRNISKLGMFKAVKKIRVDKQNGHGTDGMDSRTFPQNALKDLKPVEDMRKEIEAIIATLDRIRFDFSDLFDDEDESPKMSYKRFLGSRIRDQDHHVPKKSSRCSPKRHVNFLSAKDQEEEKQISDAFERESIDSTEFSRTVEEPQPMIHQSSKKGARGNDAQLPSQGDQYPSKKLIKFASVEDLGKKEQIRDSLDSESVDSSDFLKAWEESHQQVTKQFCRQSSPKKSAHQLPVQACRYPSEECLKEKNQIGDVFDSDSIDSGEYLRTVEDLHQPGTSQFYSQQHVIEKGSQVPSQDGRIPPKKPARLSSSMEELEEQKQVIYSLDSESSDSREFMKTVEESHLPGTSQFYLPHHLKGTGGQVPSQAGRYPPKKHVRFTSVEDEQTIDSFDSQSSDSTEFLNTFEKSYQPDVSQLYSQRPVEGIDNQKCLPKIMSVKELRDCLKVNDQPHLETPDRENDRFNELLKELWKMRKELDSHKKIFLNIVNQNLALAEVIKTLHPEVRWTKRKKRWKRFKSFFRRKRVSHILKVTKKRLSRISRFLRDVETELRAESGHFK